jgi:hypothetical protein
MPLQISCGCALCDIELSLLSNLAEGDGSFSELKLSLNRDNRLSIRELLRLLRASPADSRSDEVLAELLRFRSKRPAFTDAILVLAFVPMLHRTVRRVLAFQPSMAGEDVVQQTLGILLQFLGSDDLRVRQSHFAFAISRAVKREAFAWAMREGSKHAMLDHDGDAFPLLAIDEPFARHTQLRHFLNRCVTRGDLNGAELDLLIQYKLESANGDAFETSNGIQPNALRQRRKRLLAKLRRLAR